MEIMLVACSLRSPCLPRRREVFGEWVGSFFKLLFRTAFFGREKEASDLTSEASADLSDFLRSQLVRD